ncbi:hypothetical protein QOT17_018630 [Balamuthia mandrillaris]
MSATTRTTTVAVPGGDAGRSSSGKLLYLSAYNMVLAIGWYYVVGCVVYGYWREGAASFAATWQRLSFVVEALQVAALLEVVHVYTGMVRGSLMATIVQTLGRNHLLFVVLHFVNEVHEHPAVTALFFSWGIIELVRYPFYLLSLWDACPQFLTWLRYNLFIPSYPLGYASETAIYWLALEPIARVNFHGMRLTLPNALNFQFDYYYVVIVWVLLSFWFFPQNYMHMFSQRAKKLSTRKLHSN